MTNSENPHVIKTGITQTIQIGKIQIEEYENIQTIDQTKTKITKDHVAIPEIEIILIKPRAKTSKTLIRIRIQLLNKPGPPTQHTSE